MKIRVEFEAQLRTALGEAKIELDLADGSSVLDALQATVARGPESFASHLLTGDGGVRSSLLVFVGESAVRPGEAASRVLTEGDRVLVMPPIAGG